MPIEESDDIRRKGQLVLSFIFIISMIGYLGWYTFTQADAAFKAQLAAAMQTLVIMGVGAALAIFGLGRTVGKSKQ